MKAHFFLFFLFTLPTKLLGCGHIFHRECLAAYANVKINDGQVFMSCPHVSFDENEPTHGPDCSVQLHAFDIEALVDAETLVRSSWDGRCFLV